MSNKTIDINQRIPLDTLYVALESYLNGNYSNEYIIEQLKLEFEGENRLKKALRIVNKIILNNPLIEFIEANKTKFESAIRRKSDRDIILICLLNSAFPFSFDVLKTFGKYFAAQDLINADTIKKSISNKYGGNRSTENGIYSVVPMFLEANFFERPKQGIYEWKGAITTSSDIVIELYRASFMHNMSIIELQDYQLMDPYFMFVNN